MTDQTSKISWKRAELAVNRFVKTAETDVARLQQFKKNILEYENSGDRAAVRRELSRAQQTISQLESNLDSLQGIRKEVTQEDLIKFDNRIKKTRNWITDEIKSFKELDADYVEYHGEEFGQLLKHGAEDRRTRVQYAQYGNRIQCQEVADDSESLEEDELEEEEAQEKQLEELTRSAVHARDIMTSLNDIVYLQGEAVESIESNVETAHANVKKAGLSLNKAMALKTAGYTAAGAACGALIGGPVGLVIGLKIALVTAGAGVAIGGAVGHKIHEVKTTENKIELAHLEAASDTKEIRRRTRKDNTLF
ncbi:syntaxin-17-like [Watersipora subatra]|uniref:syntaxin-17-like n=1 Tax=Watersipora subatra TaxID=2589382 RepID=UPI00355C306C